MIAPVYTYIERGGMNYGRVLDGDCTGCEWQDSGRTIHRAGAFVVVLLPAGSSSTDGGGCAQWLPVDLAIN